MNKKHTHKQAGSSSLVRVAAVRRNPCDCKNIAASCLLFKDLITSTYVSIYVFIYVGM